MAHLPASGSLRRRVALSARLVLAWRPAGPHLPALLRSLLVSYVALGVTLYLVPGRQSSGPLAVVGLTLVVAVVGVALRPVLIGLAVVVGSLGMLLLGAVSQAITLDVAIAVAPHVDIGGQPEVLVISWLAAVAAAGVNWMLDAGSEEVFLNQLLGQAVHVAHQHHRAGGTADGGLLVVQLDGVGEDVLRVALTAGAVPTLARWLRSDTHTLSRWHTGLPATTPAAQAMLLHGDSTEVPSFRWFEKETGRLVVANRPRDAAEIEHRISTGRGLLADGGVSVSNLFSGDAPTRLLTMSDAHLPSRSAHGLASFVTTRTGLVRSIVVSAAQIVAELYQGRRQRWRDVQPRVRRGPVFAVQRVVTTVLLRDLSVAVVAEHIARAAPVIYVDFLDYDEVAHHAGPTRLESMHTLDGLDRLVGFFADVSRECAQPYEIVVLSDHGQAQGATFAQLAGATLTDVVTSLCADHPQPAHPMHRRGGAISAQSWGSARLLLAGAGAHVADAALNSSDDALAELGVVVAAAGSLAHLYLRDEPGRVRRADIDRRFPRLLRGLAAHPQIGAVMVRSSADEVVALGAGGWRLLTESGTIGGSGIDPLALFGSRACTDLLGLAGRRHVGDVVILGRFDADTGEVAAFEELVGSHGGLGGGQTHAVFLHPSNWRVPGEHELAGIDIHDLLRAHVPHREPQAVR